MYKSLDRLYFNNGFSDTDDMLQHMIPVITKSVRTNVQAFQPKIIREACATIERLREKARKESELELSSEMSRFVIRTSAASFMNIELNEEFLQVLIPFNKLLNKIIVLTYFVPIRLLDWYYKPALSRMRHKMFDTLLPVIREYRNDQNKTDSKVIRTAIDYRDDRIGSLTDEQVAETLICMLYVSSENTALALTNTLLDLFQHPDEFLKVRDVSEPLLRQADVRGLFEHSVLHNVCMESARLNTQIYSINRKPESEDQTIGDYRVGHVDTVALCPPVLMKGSKSQGKYNDPEKYYPDRFSEGEADDSESIVTWGGGAHKCPGQTFALLEIKAAVALISVAFDANIDPDKVTPPNYFAPAALVDRSGPVKLTSRNTTLDITKRISTVEHDGETKIALRLPESGVLVRSALTNRQQEEMYDQLLQLSEDSMEHKEIQHIPSHVPYPVTYHRWIRSETSNCEEPSDLISFANSFQISDLVGTYARRNFNCMYAYVFSDLFPKIERNGFGEWSMLIDLGASCTYSYNGTEVTLRSGDILMVDFSKVDCGPVRSVPNSEPNWWSSEKRRTFDRSGCCVQVSSPLLFGCSHKTVEDIKKDMLQLQ
jgi:cytochrome P450